MFESTGQFHRIPVGFGPAPSPRQNKEGKKFDWSNAEAHLTGVVYDVGREELNALLPEGYEVDPECEQPTVLFEVMNLRNLPWLAGRGYNTWGVYAGNVKCTRVSPPVIASYQLVLFESFTDPIVTGREELGFCKMYADLPDPKIENGNFVHTASWFGTEFMRLEVPNLTFRPVEESPSFKPRPYTVPGVNGIIHHRYVPAVGEPGKHDASYATFMPGRGTNLPKIKKFATTTSPLEDIQFSITSHPWEKLPTLWNIVDGLASLKLGKPREFLYQIDDGAGDCGSNKRIEK